MCGIGSFSLGQLIAMAGLDKTSMPFSAKPGSVTGEYINGKSRLDTTQQMRAILEHSGLDESTLSADLQPAYNGRRAASTVKSSTDPTQQYNRDKASVGRNGPGSKFDELYQQALRNADSILSDSGNPPDGHTLMQNLHSPVRSVVSDSDSQVETPAEQSGLHPVILDESVGFTKSDQNGHFSNNNVHAENPPDLRESRQSVEQLPPASGRSPDVNKSVDSGRVDETEISEDYTTEEDDDIEEIRLSSQ